MAHSLYNPQWMQDQQITQRSLTQCSFERGAITFAIVSYLNIESNYILSMTRILILFILVRRITKDLEFTLDFAEFIGYEILYNHVFLYQNVLISA